MEHLPRLPRLPLPLLLLATFSAPLRAQPDRLELGLRLRDYERHLAATSSDVVRRASYPAMEAAVRSFFGLDLRGAAKSIDLADRALLAEPASPEQRFARSLQISLAARLVDSRSATVELRVESTFPAETELPQGMKLKVLSGLGRVPALDCDLARLPQSFLLPVAETSVGDLPVTWWIEREGCKLHERRQQLSIVAALTPRLETLERATESLDEHSDLESATLIGLTRTLQGMTRRRAEETLLPGCRLLAEAEALATALAEGRSHYGPASSGQHWLRVPLAKSVVAARLQAPSVPVGERRPLVVALHGAGGSENLFFDGYGDGLAARLAAERGWFLVAPRSGLLGHNDLPALVDALAARWPIDRDRVLLVGHSMGAAEAISATARSPGRFRAVAAIAGGGDPGRHKGNELPPFQVVTGSRDFLRDQALALHRRLLESGARSDLKDYADVEHLTVVQIALPGVFGFFERAIAGNPPK